MFPDGPMLKEEAMLIKERLSRDELATFNPSNGWLEKFEQTCRLREIRIIMQSWNEGLPKQTSRYGLRNTEHG